MALKDITKEAVKEAINEYEEKGSEYMFEKYRGGPSRTYHLVYGDKYYPQKLIARVAHKHVTGQHLKTRGDNASATKTRKRLGDLGFTIVKL